MAESLVLESPNSNPLPTSKLPLPLTPQSGGGFSSIRNKGEDGKEEKRDLGGLCTCSDGHLNPFCEECDDGNSDNGDGCDSSCNVESGWSCTDELARRSECTKKCGNGSQDSGEACDDGNQTNGDGCDLNCSIEPPYACNGWPSTCGLCGNGALDNTEECDDGNFNASDGCSDTCTVENGWECSGTPSVCNLICSNGVIDTGEQCDDNGVTPGDGCSAICQIESGYECSGTPSSCNLICSNSAIDSGEQCDDSNATPGDGCSSTCQIESGYECNGTPSSCNLICSNSAIDSDEQCDDGGVAAGDGCDASCQIESGYECNGTPSSCNLICSNSVIDSGETCDDGGVASSDGCDATCQIESGWECSGAPSACNLICSNSRIDSGEQCDDGGSSGGDGCDSTCQIESGWECSGAPSSCNLICSNGRIDSGEQCDDDNLIKGDGCDSTCNIEGGWECPTSNPSSCNLICSNSRIDGSETCDDGNLINGDGCDDTCQVETLYECPISNPSVCNLICSNSEHNSPEECDDGNTVDNDGCDSNCKIEEGWVCSSYPSQCSFCGDGITEVLETCDDGNTFQDDGCDEVCSTEQYYQCTGQPSICKISKIEASAGVQQIGNSVSASLNAGFSFQLAIAIALGQSLSSMWILINTLQIIHYSAMMTLYFPKIVVTLFSFLGVANLENKMFSKLYLLHFDSSQVEDRASWDYRFENQNVESTNVLLNCADMFFALILFIISNILMAILGRLINNCYPDDIKVTKKTKLCTKIMVYIKRRIKVMQESFFFNSIYRLGFELFLDIGFASFYNIYDTKWENYVDYYSNIVSFICLCALFILLISIPFVYCWMPKNYDKDSGRFKVFFEDFKHSHKVYMFDHFIFLLRRLVLILVLIFRWNHGIQQVSIFVFACMIVVLWKIIARPFESAVLNFQNILFEFLLTLIILMYFKFTNSKGELASSGINHGVGLALSTIVLIIVLLNMVLTIYLYINKIFLRYSKGKVNEKKLRIRIKKEVIPAMKKTSKGAQYYHRDATGAFKNRINYANSAINSDLKNHSAVKINISQTGVSEQELDQPPKPTKLYHRDSSKQIHQEMMKFKSLIHIPQNPKFSSSNLH